MEITPNVVLLFLLRHFGPFECGFEEFENFVNSDIPDGNLEIVPDENGRITFNVREVVDGTQD